MKVSFALPVLVLASCSAFEVGKDYVYHYEGRLQVKNPEQPLQSSGFAFRSKVIAQPKPDHTYFKITEFNVDSFNGDHVVLDEHQFQYHSTNALREFIEKPFAGKFIKGKIVEIEVGKDEPLWSKNIKKGVLSIFQLDLVTGRQDHPHAEEYHVREHGLHGNCETKYMIFEKEEHLEVLKVRDLEHCDKEAYAIYGRMKGHKCVKCEALESHPLSSNSEVRYELDGNPRHYVIKNAWATSDTLFKPFGAGKAIRVVVNRTLVLDEEHAASANTQLPGDVEVSSHLTHTFSRYGKAQNPEQLKNLNHFIADMQIETNIPSFVEGLNHLAALEYDDSDIGDVETKESGALLFLVLSSSMARMRYEDIAQVYERNVLAAPEANRKNVRRLYIDLLAAVGANPHVLFGLRLAKEGKLSDDEAGHFFTRMVMNLKEHSPAVITLLADVCKSEPVKTHHQVWVKCMLSLSSIAGQHGCVRGKTEQEPDKGTCSVPLVSQFFNYSVTPADTMDKPEKMKTVYMKAAGNLGTRSAVLYLKRHIGPEGHPPTSRRTNALWSLKRAAPHHPALTRSIALPVYENKSESAVIRIAAFRCVLATSPNLYLLRHIAQNVIDDPSDQVASYVTSAFRNIVKSKYPCHLEVAQHLRYVVPMWEKIERFSKPVEPTKSHLRVHSGYDPKYDYGSASVVSMIRADDSYLPRSVYVKAMNYYAGYSYDTVALAFEGWGLNKLFDAMLGPRPGSTKNIWNFFGRRRFTREASVKDRKEIEDALPIKDKEFDPMYGRISINMFGNEIDTWEFDESILHHLKKSDKGGEGPLDSLKKQVRKKSFYLNNDFLMFVPTDIGVPVFLDFMSIDFAYVHREKFDIGHSADNKLTLDVKRRYVLESRAFTMIGVALTFNKTSVGSGADSRTVLSLPLELEATLDPVHHKLSLKRPMSLPWNILNHHYRPSTFSLPYELTSDVRNAVTQLADPQTPLYNKQEVTQIDSTAISDFLTFGMNVKGSLLTKGLMKGLSEFFESDLQQKFYYVTVNPNWHPRELKVTLLGSENAPTTIEFDLGHKLLKPEDARESKFPIHDAIDGEPQPPITHVLNADLHFKGGQEDHKIATELRYSYTSDTFKHKVQFFYDRAPTSKKPEHTKVCMDCTLKFPTPDWSKIKSLATFYEGKQVDSSLSFRYGSSCEGQSSISFNGKFTHTDDDANQIRENAEGKPRSANRLRPYYLRDMYARCTLHQKRGVPMNYYCFKYMYYSSRLAKLSVDVEYKNFNIIQKVFDIYPKYGVHLVGPEGFWSVLGSHTEGPDGKFHMVTQVPPRQKYADITVTLPGGGAIQHSHVPIHTPFLEPRIFSALGYTNIAEYAPNYKQKYCDLQGSTTRTFDGTVVQLPETDCFKVVSRDCRPDAKRFLVMARSSGNEALPKALKMFIRNTKIEILQLTPDTGLVVRVDGSRVEVTQAAPYVHHTNVEPELFRITLEHKYYEISSSTYGLSIGFNGKMVTVQVANFYRGSICGLCGDFNYDKLNELYGSDGHVHNNSLEFAKSYVVPSSDCTPP